MIDPARLQLLETCALNVLADDRVTSLPVDPIAIAEQRGILVVEKACAEEGVSGMLLRHGNEFGIVYATHIRSPGFRRFSVAHELGHYFIPGHPEHVFSDSDEHRSRAGFGRGDAIESEADHFAALLLMPRRLFVKEMNRNRDGLEAVEALADRCQTSLTATAIRYAETTIAPVAVVVSSGARIDYCFVSRSLRDISGLGWPRKGLAVPRSTPTYRLNADPAAVAKSSRVDDCVDLATWFTTDHEGEIVEEAVGLGEYGRTLTVLSVTVEQRRELRDDGADEFAEDDDSEPRWQEPTFHRSRRR